MHQIVIDNKCSYWEDITKSNFFNEVFVQLTVNSQQKYEFSFLMNCDFGGRDKKFEWGYLLISAMNSVIIIGVALHSRIWSIRYKRYALAIELKWHRFLIFILVVAAIVLALYIYASNQFKNANIALRYLGLVVAWVFCFICWDEILFLFVPLKKKLFKVGDGIGAMKIRICDVASFLLSTIMFVLGFFLTNWIYNDVMAVCICVGSIKLFKFRSLKQGFLSMIIFLVFVTIAAIILHFTLDRSYNDYATELDSPIFLTMPDLIKTLYKKCSWLPVVDVIVPGVFLSFLRKYD